MKFFVLLMTLFSFSLSCAAKEKIPLTILAHAYTTKKLDEERISTDVSDALQTALGEEFNLSYKFTNHARLIRRLSSSEPVCSFNIIKTSTREQSILFSKTPTLLFQQRLLFAHKEILETLPDAVSLESLIRKKYILGVIGSTSYEQIDSIIANNKDDIAIIWGENGFKQLTELLLNKRVDMIISYKNTLDVHLDEQQFATLDSRKIAELPTFISGYFACSKTDKGEKAIAMLEQALHTPKMYKHLQVLHFNHNDFDIATEMLEVYANEYAIFAPEK